ncbi:DUF523 domain-containing protein [Thalassolituus sp.]|uniref:DUF523 domain-containing protein n=1 Tax=Thalassolituus sp. TaxID=2030822 RepID=UPI0035168081
MKRLLISACLLGEKVRYDGDDNASKVRELQHWISQWNAQGRLVPVCPETSGGLPTPRPPAETTADGLEVLNGQARVITVAGKDVTDAFIAGAQKTLQQAKKCNAALALLAARSPSCGKGLIYDGTFSRTLTRGSGVTVALLEMNGICCFTPDDAEELIRAMEDNVS